MKQKICITLDEDTIEWLDETRGLVKRSTMIDSILRQHFMSTALVDMK